MEEAVQAPAPAASYKASVTVSGLLGTDLVLQNNTGDDLAIAANGSFDIPTALLQFGADDARDKLSAWPSQR